MLASSIKFRHRLSFGLARGNVAVSLHSMKISGLRSPHAKVGGLVYFGRMLDKIRLDDRGRLPPGFNLGEADWYFYDARCVRFLGVSYKALVKRVRLGGTDAQVLRWCFQQGGKRTAEQIAIWNTFLAKRGWRDEASGGLLAEKKSAGLGHRDDIVTWFDLFDVEEGRKPRRVVG